MKIICFILTLGLGCLYSIVTLMGLSVILPHKPSGLLCGIIFVVLALIYAVLFWNIEFKPNLKK